MDFFLAIVGHKILKFDETARGPRWSYLVPKAQNTSDCLGQPSKLLTNDQLGYACLEGVFQPSSLDDHDSKEGSIGKDSSPRLLDMQLATRQQMHMRTGASHIAAHCGVSYRPSEVQHYAVSPRRDQTGELIENYSNILRIDIGLSVLHTAARPQMYRRCIRCMLERRKFKMRLRNTLLVSSAAGSYAADHQSASM